MLRKRAYSFEQGFTLPELLVCVAILAILIGTAIPNIKTLSKNTYDQIAAADYRSIKIGIYNALTNPDTASTFVMTNQVGPRVLAAPLQGVSISAGTIANINCTTVRATGRAPRVTITMNAENRSGSKIYRYTEANGIITETVTAMP